MPSFTATPEPNNVPPRVRLDFDTQDAAAVFGTLEVRSGGVLIRSQPPVGSSVSVAYDYEAPFSRVQSYTVEGTILATGVADWTENWASLASWTGDTGQFSVAGGKASSLTNAAKIVRSSSGVVQQLTVASPVQVRIELLDATDVVVASIQIDTKATLVTSTGSTQVAGTSGFTMVASGGTVTVTGTTWSVSRAYSGSPTKIRIVALAPTATESLSWSSTGEPRGVVVDGSGNTYVVDLTNKLVRKYNAAGAQTASWSTTGTAVAIAIDSSANVYVADTTNNMIRKYSSSGAAGLTIATTSPRGVAVDSSGNIYSIDYTNNLVRKYSSAGTAGITFSTTGSPYAIAVDSSGNVYVGDITNNRIRKYTSAGATVTSWGTVAGAQPVALALDSAGNVYAAETFLKLIRKYSSAGVALSSWSTTGPVYGICVDGSNNVFATDLTNSMVRKFAQVNTAVGQIVETPVGVSLPYVMSDAATLDVAAAWLIHPGFPDLSTCIDIGRQRRDGLYVESGSAESVTRGRKGQSFSPIGRTNDVFVTTGDRRPGDWSLVVVAPRLEDRDALVSELRDQTPVLLRVPPAFDWDLPDGYYSVGDYTDQRTFAKNSEIRRVLTLPLSPTDSPLVNQEAEWTWGDVLAGYSTWSDVSIAFPTWLDVLVGPQ